MRLVSLDFMEACRKLAARRFPSLPPADAEAQFLHQHVAPWATRAVADPLLSSVLTTDVVALADLYERALQEVRFVCSGRSR
jgi:hypothetical protein